MCHFGMWIIWSLKTIRLQKFQEKLFTSSELHSDSVIHICVCVCVCVFFFRFFSLLGYYKILSIVLCAIQYGLVGYFSVYMLIPTS